MKGWLLDTNILSELRRSKPHPQVLKFIAEQRNESLFVSVITFAEIRFGIERIADIQKQQALSIWLDKELRPFFMNRVLSLDEEIILKWRILLEQGRKQGYTYSQPDLFIATTALHYNLGLVTRNIKDFEKIDIPLCNPWDN
ncbi:MULTISPECIES: type II toxin-antitoxin system VapC family toxin [unclassified Acinetobacter]|uniref:type II toxin-antitoxin system VapC family toxin n=1 Tax=unclassified Acinetobacter TaxID=196816 RepID=UPI0024487441|nr:MULTISPECIES: type II toxin-antitoxin system VapC family toxin [unclassified Acinetobacter]MDH0032185.1 type II toxin-antitoxin system VapC family toxin [Acinetobacter sp. GD04021]MDH0886040.1 type II toxin-antitoxin system VapC family toxin [Acinetobacter sp. GD03873]MDH1082660.1 type II toxin-antitoxin system VapC family toxin [Acinetobacter sp. GD03983]MDH2189545.1 type II toxin-antitoxin system VapC family toxin [Acinetobacter sp. GD03645]MDH2203624.1 type II toxin-antitoxin system VapC